jgi:hypothetical protein
MSSPLGLTFDTSSNSTKIGNYKVLDSKAVMSLFGNAQFSPFPSDIDVKSGNVTRIKSSKSVHNDDVYDTSVTSLIDYTSKYPAMKLNAVDFAYLKNIGVYPNNRLIIARRFQNGVPNDLTSLKVSPMSTLISWVKDGEDFISVAYNEKWGEAETSFEAVLNDIGKDMKGSKDNGTGIGTKLAGGMDSLPLPGLMEGLQYQVMKKMGLTDAGIGNSPLGNPNLIREAMRRTVLGKEDSGSGLVANFSVKMTVEYEQKFINGVDPTLVYMDIIQNALTFGTSDSQFQFNSAFATGTNNIISKLISGDIAQIAIALQGFVTSLLDAITSVGKDIIDAITQKKSDNEEDDKSNASSKSKSIYDAVKASFSATIGHVISKYKIKLIGIANALTGSPSTPWHITIGNPKKPTFCSGDMLCKEVTLSVGKSLAFNDLPSSIKIEFTLETARNLGAQEIFNRFNTGIGRSYVRTIKSYVETPDIQFGTASQTMSTDSSGNTTTKNEVSPIVSPQIPDSYLVSNNSGPDYINGGSQSV